jgi:hypothetical protein
VKEGRCFDVYLESQSSDEGEQTVSRKSLESTDAGSGAVERQVEYLGQQRIGGGVDGDEVEVEGAFDSAAAGEDRRGRGRGLGGELIGQSGLLRHCQWAGGCRLFHWAAEGLAMAPTGWDDGARFPRK